MKKLISFVIILSMIGFAFADEGMWTMDQIKKLDLNKKGLQIPLEELYSEDGTSIYSAIIRLESGGAGSSAFVSPNGLILTNHHVAYGAVQRASTQGTDYLTNGFLAKSNEEEIQAPGTSALMIHEIKDVTDEVLAAGEKIKDAVKREKAINRKIREITDAEEEGKVDVTARINEMYEGGQYLLYIYKRFDDVRIVYMPPLAIGNYGADIDNWMWPRHTGDFAYARVYASPDGVGRAYDPENVPYNPKKWLKISTRDLNAGDYTMVMGFPGVTTRYRTSHSIDYNRKYYYPDWIKKAEDVMAILDKAGEDSHEAHLKVVGMSKGISNYHKKFSGTVIAMDKFDYLNKTLAEEKAFQEFVTSDRKLKKKYGKVLKDIGNLYGDQVKYKKQNDVLFSFGFWNGIVPGTATNIYSIAKEREKPDSERDPGFSEKDVERQRDRLHYNYMSYYEPAQKDLLKYFLNMATMLPLNTRLKGFDELLARYGMTADEFSEYALDNTKLTDVEYAKTLFTMSSKELEELDDPMINLAAAIYDDLETANDRNERFNAEIGALRKKYIEALLLMSDDPIYPDANGSIRFTYGYVEGYSPRDAVVYKPFTTLAGAIEKNTGEVPFNLPPKLEELHKDTEKCKWYDKDLGDIPIAFTHAVETTNGSSGSAVMNAYGEVIGLAFDGNIESMLSDWQHDPAIQRTISVDIRYVMFITDKFAGADYLLEEMGIK